MNYPATSKAIVISATSGLLIAAAIAVPILASGETEEKERADRLMATVTQLAAPATAGEAVAIVNGRAITASRLDGTVALSDSGLSRKQVLEQLIDYELLYDEGVRRGLVPSDKEVQDNLDITRANTSKEAVQVAIDLARATGVMINEDEYWSHPVVVDSTRKALTVGRARDELTRGAPAGKEQEVPGQELARLRALGQVEVLDGSLR